MNSFIEKINKQILKSWDNGTCTVYQESEEYLTMSVLDRVAIHFKNKGFNIINQYVTASLNPYLVISLSWDKDSIKDDYFPIKYYCYKLYSGLYDYGGNYDTRYTTFPVLDYISKDRQDAEKWLENCKYMKNNESPKPYDYAITVNYEEYNTPKMD